MKTPNLGKDFQDHQVQPCPPDHDTECHIQLFLNHFKGWWLHHSPGQPIPVLYKPFTEKKNLPYIQPELQYSLPWASFPPGETSPSAHTTLSRLLTGSIAQWISFYLHRTGDWFWSFILLSLYLESMFLDLGITGCLFTSFWGTSFKTFQCSQSDYSIRNESSKIKTAANTLFTFFQTDLESRF